MISWKLYKLIDNRNVAIGFYFVQKISLFKLLVIISLIILDKL